MQCGQEQQIAHANELPTLDEKETKRIQSIVGSFLYHARVLNHNLLPAINETSTTQAKPTTYALDECHQMLDHAATHPDVYVRYFASDVVLTIDSDITCLVVLQTKNIIAGYYHLSNTPKKTPHTMINGATLVE